MICTLARKCSNSPVFLILLWMQPSRGLDKYKPSMRKWRSLRHPPTLKRKEKRGPNRFAQQTDKSLFALFVIIIVVICYLFLIIPPDIYKFGLIKYQSFVSLNVTRCGGHDQRPRVFGMAPWRKVKCVHVTEHKKE